MRADGLAALDNRSRDIFRRIVEVQGTAEGAPFSEADFLALLGLARTGIRRLVDLQKMAVS